jgi:uncharacterized heparinase superfamily protein
MLARSALYWRTARYLRPRQFAYQVLHRLRPYRSAPLPAAAPAARAVSGSVEFAAAKRVGGSDPWSFRFLNVSRSFREGCVDWTCPDMPRLWRYNLQYFGYLGEADRSASQKAQLIDDWIRRNPPGTADAWEPYTASLRIANWTKYFLSLSAPDAALAQWLASLWSQGAWLRHNIEYHLLANHLFKNAKALVFAGAFFEDPAAGEWLRKGAQILVEQLEEQFLADGGHFERSPMYHAIMVEDLLDLIALDRAIPAVMPTALVAALTNTANRALEFLRDLTLADGEIALFNDAAHDIAAPTQRLLEYAARLPMTATIRPRTVGELIERAISGYYGWNGPRDGWLIDCGPVGPDYQPGHAHCDTLSYELVLDGRRIVADTGVHDYEPGERRHRSRSTASHNTVMVDGAEQSEIWGTFRVGCRARAIEAKLTNRAGVISFVGAHDGYRRLPDGVVHRRTAEYRPDRSLLVSDELTGNGRHIMDNRVHFAPALRVSGHGRSLAVGDSSGVMVARLDIGEGPAIHVEAAEQYPEFGRTERIDVVRLRSEGALPLRQHYTITRV